MAKNPIDIGAKIYEVLTKLYGKAFTNKMIGTQSNVIKPVALDVNAPTKSQYSKSAYKNSKTLEIIDEKIMEYAPSILANKNMKEKMNFLENAENLLASRKTQTGSNIKTETETGLNKKGAEILDIKTGKKVEGIETIKQDLGLPPEVSPKSEIGKALLESKRSFKEEGKDFGDETLAKAVDTFFGNAAKTFNDARRRPIIRQILAEEDIIQKNLSEQDYDDLLFAQDLNKGADPNKDPFVYLNKYFVRDEDQLDILDNIIDEMPGSTPAEISAEFKKRTGGLKPKDLGDKLKDLPDDIDPDALAEGGRPGKGLDYLMGL